MAYGPWSDSDSRTIFGKLVIHIKSGITKAAVFPLPTRRGAEVVDSNHFNCTCFSYANNISILQPNGNSLSLNRSRFLVMIWY